MKRFIKKRKFFKNFHKNKYFHLSVCAALCFASALILLPFLQAERHTGHDLKYHFTVIRALNVAWKEGSFGGKIIELIGGDYGYGTGIFYSTLPASMCVILMQCFHLSMISALYAQMFLLFAGASVVMYFFLFRVFTDGRLAAGGALIYLVFPYFLWDLYVRFAYTEIFLMLAMPLIVWGVYELLYKTNVRAFFALFVMGYSLAIFCHFTMTVYITIFVGLWLLIECKKTFKIKKLAWFSIATVIVLLITASYYIPMLVNYGVTDTQSMSKTAEQIKVNTLKYYTEEILTLDFSLIAACFVLYVLYYIFCANGKRAASKTTILVATALILLLYCPYFPWKYAPNFLRMIQYTFRVLLLAGITTPLIVCTLVKDVIFGFKIQKEPPVSEVSEEKEKVNVKKTLLLIRDITAIAILCVGIVFCGYVGVRHDRAMLQAPFKNGGITATAMDEITGHSDFYGLGAGKHGDYFPLDCKWSYVSTRMRKQVIVDGNVSIAEVGIYDGISQLSFLIKKTENSYVILNVPYALFKETEVHRFQTSSNNKELSVFVEKDGDGSRTRLEFTNYGGESKILICYKNAPKFKAYLQENAFGVLTLEGEVSANCLQKEKAGKYSLEVTASERGGVLELPSYYYKGYTLTLVQENGEKKKLQPIHGRNGFLEVEIQESGTLYVQFTSAYLTLSYVLSGLGALAFVGGFASIIVLQKKGKTAWV